VKNRLPVTVALAVGLGVACTQSGNPPVTGLSGTNSVLASGSLVFVTSTASNELRVLLLNPPPGTPPAPVDYVRAPNPLSSLSIPTLTAPIDLATPTRYGPLGQPLTGDWVFVRGAGSPAVSVIGAVNCPQQLREFGRIEPRGDAVITAMASRLTSDDTLAYLYLATFDGETSTLWEVVLPNQPRDRGLGTLGGLLIDTKNCPKYPSRMPPYTLRAIAPIPGAVVTALAALPTVVNPKDDRPAPPVLPEEKRLVVGTRLLAVPPNPPGALTEEGMITVIDPSGVGSVFPHPLVFAPYCTVNCPLTPTEYFQAGRGFPVKKLISHGNVVKVTFDTLPDGGTIPDAGIRDDALGIQFGIAEVVMDAGTRVFGVLDESACGGTQDCVGIFAVDLDRPAADGGFLPVAVDGSDSLVNLVQNGVIQRDDAGIPIRNIDGYYRPPNRAFFDGGIPVDVNRMLPIKFGNGFSAGIIQDIALQSSGIIIDPVFGFPAQFGLLGVATLSGTAGSTIPAHLFVFDGMTLRQINITGAPPAIQRQRSVLGDGAQAIFDGGPVDIRIGQGVWPFSESVFVLYEGIVGGVAGEGLDAGLGDPLRDGGGIWPVSINNRNAVQEFVLPGDVLVPVDSTRTECLFAYPLLDNGVDGGVLFDEPGGPFLHTRAAPLATTLNDGGMLLFADGGIPTVATSCPPPFAYNIRSSGLSSGPLTVSGTRSGFLGRVALPDAGRLTSFEIGENTIPGSPRFWRPSVDAGTPATDLPTVGFGFNLRDQTALGIPAVEPVLTYGDTPELRGAGYQIDILNGFAPASVGIDQTTLNIALLLPGSVALYQRQIYPLLPNGSDRVFVLYPSSNTILDFSPTTVTYTSVNSGDIGLHF